jgi:hypothetical protein
MHPIMLAVFPLTISRIVHSKEHRNELNKPEESLEMADAPAPTWKSGMNQESFVQALESKRLDMADYLTIDGLLYHRDTREPVTGVIETSIGNAMRTSERATYKNGEKTGLWEEFYENGVLKIRGNYKNNLPDGPWDYWDKDGKQTGAWEYVDGVAKLVE